MDLRIGVCIPTCNRQEYLKKLLDQLTKLDKNNEFEFILILVDNDKTKSSEKIYLEYISRLNIYYLHEEKKGYSIVRNKCLYEARKLQCDYIAFLDDDEYPSITWLNELYNTAQKYKADLVFGPVFPVFSEKVEDWIVRGKFFVKGEETYLNISDIPKYTCNVLIKVSSIKDRYFDNNFNKLGGEDTKFFNKLLQEKKCTIIWNYNAVVYENIPSIRLNIKYLLRRAYNCGKSNSLLLKSNGKKCYIIILMGIGNIFIGFFKLLISLTKTMEFKVKSLQIIYRGLGRIIGTINLKYNNNR